MRLVFVLAALHCLAFIDRTMIGGVLPLMRDSVAMTDAQAGWIIGTAFALPYGAAALGLAALRRGRAASGGWLAIGALIWTAGSLGTGLAHSLGTLTAARATLGIGQGIFVPLAIARLIDGTRPDDRSRALGVFTGGATFGRSIALLMTGALLAMIGPLAEGSGVVAWRWLFILTALPNVVILILLATRRTTPPALPAAPAMDERTDWRLLLPFFLVAVAPVMFAQAVMSWLPTLFVRERGLAAADAALLIGSVTLFAAPAGPVIGGWLFGRFRRCERHMPMIVLSALVATLSLLAVLIHARSLTGAVASLAILLVTLGMAAFAGLFGVQLRIPPSSRVSVNGIYLAFITMVGVGLGPLLAGIVATGAGRGGTTLGQALLVTGGVATAGCALAVVLVHATARRPA
jgi:MFS family permease